MTEEILFPVKTLFSLLRIAALFVLIITFVWLFISSTVVLKTQEMERIAVEVSDGIINSLPDKIFTESQLNSYKDTNIEPYARHCYYGYYIEITALNKTKNEWKFGFHPDDDIKNTYIELPTAVMTGQSCSC